MNNMENNERIFHHGEPNVREAHTKYANYEQIIDRNSPV